MVGWADVPVILRTLWGREKLLQMMLKAACFRLHCQTESSRPLCVLFSTDTPILVFTPQKRGNSCWDHLFEFAWEMRMTGCVWCHRCMLGLGIQTNEFPVPKLVCYASARGEDERSRDDEMNTSSSSGKTRTPFQHTTHTLGYTTLRSAHITCFSAKLTKALVSSGRCVNRTQTLTLAGFSEPSALRPWFKTRIRRNFMNRICKHLWGQIWLVA